MHIYVNQKYAICVSVVFRLSYLSTYILRNKFIKTDNDVDSAICALILEI
jgi:hypothetical protein